MSAADRARAAHAKAQEDGLTPNEKAAWLAAAATWERIAGGGRPYSLKPLRRDLANLKRELALASGPFTPKTDPKPPAAPAPARVAPARVPQPVTIDF